MRTHILYAALTVAAAGAVACGAPQPARKTVSAADTMAAFGHTQVDSAALAANKANRSTITQAQLDSQNAAIRASLQPTKLAAPKRVVRKSP